MASKTAAQALAEIRASKNTTSSGFDAAKFKALQEQSQVTPTGGTSVVSRDTQSIGSRVADFVGGATYGFGSIGRTAQKGFAKAWEGVTGKQSFIQPGTRESFEKTTGTDLDTNAGKVGNFVGETALYATPGGASMAAPQLAFRGGVGMATQALSSGGLGKDVAVAGVSNALLPPAISGASRLVGNLLKNVAKGSAGIASGQGTKVIEAIYKNPEAARQGLREAINISADATTVRTGIKNIAKRASQEFADDLNNLPKRLGRTPEVITNSTRTTIKAGGKTYILSKQGVKSQLTQSLRQFDVVVDPRRKSLDFSKAPLSSSDQKTLTEVFRIIDNWDDTTPAGFHKLARKVSKGFKGGQQSKELNSIIDAVESGIKGYIKKRVPAAGPMYKKYETAMDTLKAFNQEFGYGGAGKVDELAGRIKTERKVGNIFTGQKDSATEMLSTQIADGADIPARQAGRLLADPIPRSQAAIGDFLQKAINLVLTPKAVGEIAAYLGTTAPKAERLLARLQSLDPAARAVLIQTISDLWESEAQPGTQDIEAL